MKLEKNKDGYWRVSFVGQDGRRHRVSTRTKDKAEAKRAVNRSRLGDIEATAKAGMLGRDAVDRALTGKRSMTFAKALEAWLEWERDNATSTMTIYNKESRVTAWLKDMKLFSKTASSLTTKHISDWIHADDKGSLGNRQMLLACIRAFCKWMSIAGHIQGDPSRLVRIKKDLLSHDQKEKRVINLWTDQQVKHLLKQVHPSGQEGNDSFWYCAVLLGRYAGMRLGDVCQLRQECLSTMGYLVFWTDKRQTRVEIPLDSQPIREAVTWLPPRSDYLWPVAASEIVDPKIRSKYSVRFRRLVDAVGLPGDLTFHGLRHSFAMDCMKKGVDYPHIAALMGHMKATTTKRHYLRHALKST